MENGKESMTIDQLLATLAALHEAATAGEWVAEYPINEQTAWIIEAQKPAYEWRCLAMVTEYDEEVSPNEGKANLDFILAAHNHYPALREEIKRLREENARLSDLAVQRANMIAQMDSQLSTAKRIGAAEELRRLADEWELESGRRIHADRLRDRAADLEVKCTTKS